MIAIADYLDDVCEWMQQVDYREPAQRRSARVVIATKRSLTGREKQAERSRHSGKSSISRRGSNAERNQSRYPHR